MVNLFEYASMTESEKEFERVLLSSDIEVEKVFKEFTMSLALEGIDGGVMLEADGSTKKSDNLFIKAIDTIISKIAQILQSIISLFKDLFKGSSDEEKAMNAYFASSTEQIRFDSDVRKIRRECEKEVEDGSKLVKAISSKTGADPASVKKFCDGAGFIARIAAPITLSAGVAWAVSKAMGFAKGKDDICKRIESASNDCKKIQDPEKRKQALAVLKGMKESYQECIDQEKGFLKRLKLAYNANKDVRGVEKAIRTSQATNKDLYTSKLKKSMETKKQKKEDAKIAKQQRAAEEKQKNIDSMKDKFGSAASNMKDILS